MCGTNFIIIFCNDLSFLSIGRMFDHEEELIDVLLCMEPIPERSPELNPEPLTESASRGEVSGGGSSSGEEEGSSVDSSSNGGDEDQGGNTVTVPNSRSTPGSSGGRRRRRRKRKQKNVELQETLEEKYERLRKGKLYTCCSYSD